MQPVTDLDPQPTDLPPAFPSPFDEPRPHPVAQQAANLLEADLRAGWIAPGLPTAILDGTDGGKMFGVLVVENSAGRIGFLRAYSGMLDGRWDVAGFVPPLFDRAVRAQVEPAGDAVVKALSAEVETLAHAPELAAARGACASLAVQQAEELAEFRERRLGNREQRHARRAMLAADDAAAREALDQESRGDKSERRRIAAAHELERQALHEVREQLEQRLLDAAHRRQTYCRALMSQIHDTYQVVNARGESRSLRELYSPGEPPAGAGDCAAPKLLAFAYAHGLRPVALAEFWWGAPPNTGGRIAGAFYSACRDKCAPLLPFMLDGLAVATLRAFAPPAVRNAELRIVFEDAWLVVLDKPAGQLSVPGRSAIQDSVLARLRARSPEAPDLLLVHRLDMDTSGLLVAAKDLQTHKDLQRQFARREVVKRYIAWVAGRVDAARGTIDLAMRPDIGDRPRQIHDPIQGKSAVTDWVVEERTAERTRVALFPRTGRTHQLRVHAAHPLGLGSPIVGDRLYGHVGGRLMLHAEALEFRHPHTGQSIRFESPAPF